MGDIVVAVGDETKNAYNKNYHQDSMVNANDGNVLNNNMKDNVIRLDFESLDHLYGRHDQIRQLEEAFHNQQQQPVESPVVVFVKGSSGVGKTALVQRTLEGKGMFANGKFDRLGLPFAAIFDSLRDLCHYLTEDEKVLIREHLSLNSEIPVPLLDALSDRGDSDEDSDSAKSEEFSEQSFPVLKEAICTFLKTVSQEVGRRIVFFLDDVQWATAQEIDIIKAVILAAGVFFVGAYRDNEVDQVHPLQVQMREMKRQGQVDIKVVPVGALTIDDLAELLVDLLEQEDVGSLPAIVHQSTGGNVFLANQFIRTLQNEDLIRPCDAGWEWDIAQITSRGTTDTVVARIKQLRPETQEALQIASCFGSMFEASLILRFMKAAHHCGENSNPFQEAIDQRLVSKRRSAGKYKFVHDKFKESAYESIPDDEQKQQLHHRIGSFLVDNITASNKIKMLPLAASQLNRSPSLIVDEKERIKVAQLNLDAAKCAMKQSAFFPASNLLHASTAMSAGSTTWNENYALRLESMTLLADVQFFIGSFEDSRRAIDEVKCFAKTFDDKVPVLLREVELLGSRSKLQDAINCAVILLHSFGEHFPKKATKAHVVVSFAKTKLALRRFKNDDDALSNLPEMHDKSAAMCLKIYSLLSTFCWLAAELEALALIALRCLQLTLSKGAGKFSAHTFAGFGLILLELGNGEAAHRFGDISKRYLTRFPDRECRPRTLLLLYFHLHPIRHPVHESLEPLLYAHQIGFDTGDVQYGEGAAIAYCTIYVKCGLPLEPVSRDMRSFLAQMDDYSQFAAISLTQLYLQMTLNMMGESANPAVMTGAIINETDMLTALTQDGGQALRIFWSLKLILLYMFDERTEMAKTLLVLRRKVKSGGFTLSVALRIFMRSLASSELAISTGQRKYKDQAKRLTRRMKQYVEKGKMINYYHMVELLLAEQTQLDPRAKHEDIKDAYFKAIRMSTRRGFVPDTAIATERLARYLLTQNEPEDAKFYLQQSKGLYKDWGAIAKVQHMDQTYPFLASEKLVGKPTTYHLGQDRFSSTCTTDKHKGVDWRGAEEGSNDDGNEFRNSSSGFATRLRRTFSKASGKR